MPSVIPVEQCEDASGINESAGVHGFFASIDRADRNRSAFLERAARACLAGLEKAKREARDVAIIDVHADRLNQEAMDVLDYQAGSR